MALNYAQARTFIAISQSRLHCLNCSGAKSMPVRVTHGSRRATTKDENGPRHLCFVFNAIGSYFHRSVSTALNALEDLTFQQSPDCERQRRLSTTRLNRRRLVVGLTHFPRLISTQWSKRSAND